MKGQLILSSSSENRMVTIKTEKLSRAQLECANHSVKSHPYLNRRSTMMQWLKRWSAALGVSLLAACGGGGDVTPNLVDTAKALKKHPSSD
jgi:hypothetical protein